MAAKKFDKSAAAPEEKADKPVKAVAGAKTGKLALLTAGITKVLKTKDWKANMNSDQMTESHPHVPTGSLVIDYLIGGAPNAKGVAPCPGLPRKRITQLWGQEGAGKCLPADTYVTTPEGIFTIGELFERSGLEASVVNRTTEKTVSLLNRNGQVESTTHFTHNGRKTTYSIRSASGGEVRSTGNHPHLVMDTSGYWVWKMTRNIRPGDTLVSLRQANFGTNEIAEDDAYSVGLLVADGSFTSTRISVTNDDPDIKQHIVEKMGALFVKAPLQYDNNGKGSVNYHFNDVQACAAFYERFGLAAVGSPAKKLSIPIRTMSKNSLRSFLQGYVDCECSVDVPKSVIEVSSASHELLRQVKLLLTGFGVVSQLREKKVAAYPDNQYWRLTISGAEARRFVREVGTRSKLRMASYELLLQSPEGSTNFDTVPNCGPLVAALWGQELRDETASALSGDYKGTSPKACLTRDRLGKILAAYGNESLPGKRLQEIYDADYVYDEVESVDANEPEPTFDFAMSTTASFIANGFVTHNTTLALTTAASVCRAGGVVVYVDWENAIVLDYAQTLGVPVTDEEKFLLAQPSTLEEGIKIIQMAALAGVDLIVIDSVGAAVPANIQERGAEEAGEQARVGLAALRWSEFLPALRGYILKSNTAVLGISQVRAKIGGMGHGPKSEPQGGWSWKFYTDLRIEITRIQQEKTKMVNKLTNKTEERVSGAIVKAKIVKCKLSDSQGREENFYLRHGEGIDDIRAAIEIAVAHSVVRKSGGWYYYDDHSFQGMEAVRKFFGADPKEVQKLIVKIAPFLTRKMETGPEADVDEEDIPSDLEEFIQLESVTEDV